MPREQKEVEFCGSSEKDVNRFGPMAREQAFVNLEMLRTGFDVPDVKQVVGMPSGILEMRVRVSGEFRIIYVAKLPHYIYVLHAFEKKSQKISREDMKTLKLRLKSLEKRIGIKL
jgi:phage-related protein